MAKEPKISIIITTKNEAQHIGNLLKSITKQSYKNIEVIVVDNNSNDETKTIARKYTNLVFDKGPERSAQRNFGALKSSGTILLFLDADMELAVDVVANCISLLQDSTIQSVVIPEQSFGKGFWSTCKSYERSFYLGVSWIESARCFRKQTFEVLGGYDEQMSGPEDFDFAQQVAVKFGPTSVSRISSLIYHNEGTIHIIELWHRKYYYGKSLHSYIKKDHNTPFNRQQGSIFSRYGIFFRQPGKLLSHPIVAGGMLIMKTGELCALALGLFAGRNNHQ